METFINNRYRLVEPLGRGGMGMVYLVEDALQDNRLMALKTIRADLLLERNLTQFKYEFSALGQLRHPNLVEVYDFGVIADGNEYFFTMEHVPGEELSAYAYRQLKNSPGDYTWLYDITVQICRVLQYIHSRGFIHYDVKPRNVRMAKDGVVKLMDFGLVGEVRGEGQLKIRGTPEYIAPELIRGGRVDHRVDLYSLGISLYEIVTGQPPFTGGSSLVILRQHVENTPPPPSHFVHDLPEALQSLILKLMSKEPINRYSSAEAVIQAVNQLTGSSYLVETKETKRGYIQSGDFVGRSFELARLQGLLMRVMQGQGRLVLITGAMGVGKTRLVRELRLRAQMQRVLVCQGACREQGRAPYHPWIPILGQVISYQQATKSELLHQHGKLLLNLMPELAQFIDLGEVKKSAEVVSETLAVATETISEELNQFNQLFKLSVLDEFEKLNTLNQQADKKNLMEIVLAFLMTVNRPLMIVLDDLHYADAESIELLNYLSKNATKGRWLFCGVYRDSDVEAQHPLNLIIEQARPAKQLTADSLNEELPSGGKYELIDLQPLTKPDSAELVGSMLGAQGLPPSLLNRLMIETGGNPLFIESLMQSLIEEDLLKYDGEKWHTDLTRLSQAPTNIQDAAQRRLKRLDSDTLDFLQWAAVMGQWLDLDVLGEVCDLTPDQIFQLMASVSHQHVLTLQNHLGQASYHFSTDQMRRIVYQTLPPQALAARHWRVGQALRKLHHENEVAERLAWHFEQANDWALALHYTQVAADKARQVYANESAITYYNQALAILEQHIVDPNHPELTPVQLEYDILAGRESCYRLLGDRVAQQSDITRMVKLAQAMENPAKQVLALTRQVTLANGLGNYAEAKRAAASAMSLTFQLHDHRIEAEILNALGAACLRLGEVERAQASHEHALTLYRDADLTESSNRLGEANSLSHLGYVAQATYNLDEAQSYFNQALAIYKELGHRRGEAQVLNAFAQLTQNLGEQVRYRQQALELFVTIGDRSSQAETYYNLGLIFYTLGVYPQARHNLEQALEIARELKQTAQLMDYLQDLGRVYVAMEAFDLAQPILEEGYNLARKQGTTLNTVTYQIALGCMAVSRERFEQAHERLQRAATSLRQLNEAPELLAYCLAWLSQAYLALGNTAAAHRATAEAVGYLETRLAEGPLPDLMAYRYPAQYVWWYHYQMLQIVYDWSEGEPLSEEAWLYLHRSHDAVMAMIAHLDNKSLHHTYLAEIKINRDIVREWVTRSSRMVQIDEDLPSEVNPNKGNQIEPPEDKLKRILGMAAHMNETHDIDELLNYVLDQMIELTHAERCFLALVDQSGQLDFKVGRGSEVTEDIQDLDLQGFENLAGLEDNGRAVNPLNVIYKAQVSYTIIGTVAQSREPILLYDALADKRFGRQKSVLDLNLRSVLCVPLIARSSLVGLIYADSRTISGCFNKADLDMANIFASQAAVAIENTQLFQQTKQANQMLEAWTRSLEERVEERTAELKQANLALLDRALQLQISSQVAQQVTSILSLPELLHQVVELIQNTSGYDFVGIWLPVERKRKLALRAGTGEIGLKLQAKHLEISLETGYAITQAYLDGTEQQVSHHDPDYLPIELLPNTQVELVLPLRIGSENEITNIIIGVLDIHSNHQQAFSNDEKMVLQLLANQIASAIRNAQLYERESYRRQLYEALEKSGRVLSSSLDVREVPGRVLAELATVVPYERGLVLLQHGQELISSAKHGFPEHEEAAELHITIREDDIYERMVKSKSPLVLDDVIDEPTWHQLPWLPINHSWMGVPLISKGEIIGMLSLTRPDMGAFTDDEVSIVTSFAAQAAISLENSNLYTEIKYLNEGLEQGVRERTEELNRAYASLTQLNKTKTDFILVAAHELRTPMTVISAYTQMIKVNPALQKDANMATALDGILSGFQRLHEIVNSMLDVAKIDADALQMHREQTLLGIIIDRACAKFKAAFEERKLNLMIQGLEGMPAIHADSQLLSKVFYNLVNNAIKYTPDGGNIDILWRLVPNNDEPTAVEVIIKDTGIGISPDHTEIIFEKFFQTGEMALHSSSKTRFKGGGPGLGLAIVKGIVLAHGGKIWAESPGKNEETCPGSSFHVELPLQ